MAYQGHLLSLIEVETNVMPVRAKNILAEQDFDTVGVYINVLADSDSSDLTKKPMSDMNLNQYIWLGLAVLMLIPILMVFLNLLMPLPVGRWVNIIVAVFFFLFNLAGLPTYPSLYDKFLLAVSMGFNGITIWYAWNWS